MNNTIYLKYDSINNNLYLSSDEYYKSSYLLLNDIYYNIYPCVSIHDSNIQVFSFFLALCLGVYWDDGEQ